ncbi:MAG: hypothetical protein KC609_19225 [Myxococcales bacterium]|nr:hypothetical protein [Myxococcales bacterium]
MEECKLTIRLDRRGRRYVPGAVVSGTIEVDSQREWQCNALTASLVWIANAHGEPSEESETGFSERRVLFSGRFEAERTTRHEFELVAPAQPLTYQGESLSVAWRVHVEAQIAGSRSIEATQHIVLVPGQAPPPDENALIRSRPAQPKRFNGLALFGGLTLLLLALALTVPSLGILLVLFASTGGLLWFSYSPPSSRWGGVDLEMPRVLRSGEPYHATIRVNPKRQMNVKAIRLELEARESSRRRDASFAPTQHTIVERSMTIADERSFQPRPHALQVRGVAPTSTAYSFEGERHSVRWLARVTIELVEGVSRSDELELDFRPSFDGPPPQLDAISDGGTAEDVTAAGGPAVEAPATPAPAVGAQATDTNAEAALPAEAHATPAHATEAFDAATPVVESERNDVERGANAAERLVAIDSELRDSRTLGGERERLIEAHSGTALHLPVIVDHVEWTYTSDLPSRLIGGRTIVGWVEGTRCQVAICAPPEQNAEVERLVRGSVAQFELVVVRYDELYQRIVLESRDVDGPAG